MIFSFSCITKYNAFLPHDIQLLYAQTHLDTKHRGGSPHQPLFLAANIFLKFAYKKLNYMYHGVCPQPFWYHVKI